MFRLFFRYFPVRFVSQRVKRCRSRLPIVNFGIVAHIDAGKTTTTERMLYNCGAIRVMGDVDDGDTVMDYMIEERERGITVRSAAISTEWKSHKLNIIDTPGHADFTVEVQRSLSVLDGAVVILDATAGVQAQTASVWHYAMNLPKVVYLNKVDLKSANIDLCLTSLKEMSDKIPLLLYHPLRCKAPGIVDLITLTKYIYDDHSKSGFPVSIEKLSKVDSDLNQRRIELLDNLASLDETFAAHILKNDSYEVQINEISHALNRCIIQNKAYPVLVGSSFFNIGVDMLLDAVISFLPAVGEDTGPVFGTVFKVIYEPTKNYFLSFVRVYGSGSLKKNTFYKNLSRKKSRFNLRQLYAPYGSELDEIDEIKSGDIGIIAGCDNLYSGDVISPVDVDISTEFEPLEPVFFCNIESDSSTNEKKLLNSLQILSHEDPSLQVEFCDELRTITLHTMGELHVSIILSRLKREFKVNAITSPLSVTCFEVPLIEATKVIERTQENKRVVIRVTVKPYPEDILSYVKYCTNIDASSLNFDGVKLIHSEENPMNISHDHMNLLNHGASSALSSGPRQGFRVIGARIYVSSLYTNTNSPFLSYVMSECVRLCLSSAQCVLLEPVAKIAVHVVKPEHVQSVLSALNMKKGQIISVNPLLKRIEARAPLEHLQSFGVLLRSLASGTGSFHMEKDGYEPVSD